MKRLTGSIRSAIVLSIVAFVALTTAAGASPVPSVTVGTWGYVASDATSNATVSAVGINWDAARPDTVCLRVPNPSYPDTYFVNECVSNIKGPDNKSPQNLPITKTIAANTFQTGSSYSAYVVLLKRGAVLATSSVFNFTGGTSLTQ